MTFRDPSTAQAVVATLDPIDRIAIAYLTLPLAIFLAGWFELWVALPMLGCMAYALSPVIQRLPAGGSRLPASQLQISIAVVMGCGWTVFGGADHILFANADWHVRDAVLHDLVVSPWPVGYGTFDGQESLLRAPIAFYLPAALVGKIVGLSAAHLAMGVWTAIGSALFLLQVLTLTPSRWDAAMTVVAVVVLFSGLDIVGSLMQGGSGFRNHWNITTHLEWWAHRYQYSSVTTQLFWVPNHALGGWLMVGLLCRNVNGVELDLPLPMAVVALALWSPLTAIGAMPFVIWRLIAETVRGRLPSLVHPRVWLAAFVVGVAVASYLLLDASAVQKGITPGRRGGDAVTDLWQQAQFFLLEAGFIGAAVLAVRRSGKVVLALIILAVLPLVYLGPANDFVMRASIPSLAVLAIGASLALISAPKTIHADRKKVLLVVLLVLGSITPVEEFARAVVLPAWPINLQATLIGANCGQFAPHYVARLNDQFVARIMREPYPLSPGPHGPSECDNPALDLMWLEAQKINRPIGRLTSVNLDSIA